MAKHIDTFEKLDAFNADLSDEERIAGSQRKNGAMLTPGERKKLIKIRRPSSRRSTTPAEVIEDQTDPEGRFEPTDGSRPLEDSLEEDLAKVLKDN